MKPGPRPKPTSLLVLQGEKSPARLHKDVLMAAPGTPLPPRGLTARERSEFRTISAELEALGIASTADSIVIGVLARAVCRAEAAARLLERDGQVVPGARGGPIRNPAALVLAEAEQTKLRAASALGLDPTSRERLRSPVSDVPISYSKFDDGV